MSRGAAHDVSTRAEAAIIAALGRRSVVLVGMMGSGKSSIGRCGDRKGGRHVHY